jgi:cytochrome c553
MWNSKKQNSNYLPLLIILLIGAALTSCSLIAPLSEEGLVTNPVESSSAQENISISSVPPEALSLFAQNCSACHGRTGEGTNIAPPLNSEELRNRLDNEAIFATISNGRPGTAMPVWGGKLTESEIATLVALIRNWDQLNEEQLAAIAEQAEDCNSGMGMHPGMGPMMGRSCGQGMGSPMWWPLRP